MNGHRQTGPVVPFHPGVRRLPPETSQEMSGAGGYCKKCQPLGGPHDPTNSRYLNLRFSGLRCGSVKKNPKPYRSTGGARPACALARLRSRCGDACRCRRDASVVVDGRYMT